MMKKRILAASVLATLACAAPAGIATADVIPGTPACNIYVSNADIPVTMECVPYTYNGTVIYNGFTVNPGH